MFEKRLNQFLQVDKEFFWYHLYCLLTGTAGACLLLFATSYGMGISPDSISYLDSAENLHIGKGLTSSFDNYSPMIHFPPLYSFLISLMQNLMSGLAATRMFNVLAFAGSIAILTFIMQRFSDRGIAMPCLLISLFIFSEITIRLHSMVWTEPLFLFFMLACFALLDKYMEKTHTIFLILATIFASASLLIRYSGIAVILTGATILLIVPSGSFKTKLKQSLVFSAISLLPFFFWSIRNILAVKNATGREFSIHIVSETHIFQLFRSFLFLIFPDSFMEYLKQFKFIVGFLAILAFISTFVALYFLWRNRRSMIAYARAIKPSCRNYILIFALFIVVYAGFLIVSISFFDASTPLCTRILSPIFLSILILFSGLVDLIIGQKLIRIIMSAVLFIFMILYIARAYSYSSKSHANGIEFNSRYWKESEIMERITT